jgi:hypothetical protein
MAKSEVVMDPFRAYVRNLAKNRVGERIRTSSKRHAIAIFEAMFGSATKKICIFTEQLLPDVFGAAEVIDAAGSFISRPQTILQVLVQTPKVQSNWGEHPLFRALTSGPPEGRGRIVARAATGSYARDTAHHFAVVDEVGYRFEVQHDTAEAIASFSEPTTAKQLQVAFDEAFNLSQQFVLFDSHNHVRFAAARAHEQRHIDGSLRA